MLHRVDDDQPEHGDQYHHDHQHADQRGEAGDGADLVRGHAPERTAVALERVAEDDEILDASAEHGADDDPQSRGQVAELRGEDRADERSGSGDRGEVMAEGDPFWGGHVVAAVVQAHRGSDVRVVEFEHAIGDEARVEAVAERIDAYRGDDEPQHAGFLAARQREYPEGGCAKCGDGNPQNDAKRLHVRNGFIAQARRYASCPKSHLIALLARTRQIPSMRVLPSTQTAFSTAHVLAVLIDATLRWNLTSHSRTNGEKNSETLVQNCSPVIRRRRAVLQRRRRIRTIQQHLELEHRDHNFGPGSRGRIRGTGDCTSAADCGRGARDGRAFDHDDRASGVVVERQLAQWQFERAHLE